MTFGKPITTTFAALVLLIAGSACDHADAGGRRFRLFRSAPARPAPPRVLVPKRHNHSAHHHHHHRNHPPHPHRHAMPMRVAPTPAVGFGFGLGVGGGYDTYGGYRFGFPGPLPPGGFGYPLDPYRTGSFKEPDLLDDPIFQWRHKYDSHFRTR